MKKALKKGFTLVELVIVIAVIAILSAILIPTFGNVISNAKKSAAQSEASNAITQYVTNAAQAGQSADIGDGYVFVLKSRTVITTTSDNTTSISDWKSNVDYVFTCTKGAVGTDAVSYKSDTFFTTGNPGASLYDLVWASTASAVKTSSTDTATGTINISGSTVTTFGVYLLDYKADDYTCKVIILSKS